MTVVILESCCIRGYHVYCNIWDSKISEELLCDHKLYEFAINDVIVIVHILHICSLLNKVRTGHNCFGSCVGMCVCLFVHPWVH